MAPIPVYITCLGGTFVLKRMPCTGGLHAVDCLHYEPPEGMSGSADIAAAISEDPDTGITNLDVELSLSCGFSRPMSHGATSETSSVGIARPRLSLRGLLQFLWNEAELTTWKPAFTGKRSWAVVRHHLLRAAAKKVVRGQPLANVLFVPEAFTVAHKEQIAARRASRFADGSKSSGEGQGKMIVIGEVKELLPVRSAPSIVLKHLPDLPFSIEAATHRRMTRIYENELSLWCSSANVHLVIVATFTVSLGGQVTIDELGLVPTSGQWIPADDAFELRLVDCLVHEGRLFRKMVRLNATVPSLSPSAMLLDVKAEPPSLALDRYLGDSVDVAIRAESGLIPNWIWRIREGDPPALPQ